MARNALTKAASAPAPVKPQRMLSSVAPLLTDPIDP
jgi:hypothetical protein